jgi:hypothetical protein
MASFGAIFANGSSNGHFRNIFVYGSAISLFYSGAKTLIMVSFRAVFIYGSSIGQFYKVKVVRDFLLNCHIRTCILCIASDESHAV